MMGGSNHANLKEVFGTHRIGPRAYRGMRYRDWEAAQHLGRLPTDSQGRTHFTSDRDLAVFYARLWAERHGDRPIVVSFPTPPIELVMPDDWGMTAGAENVGDFRTEFYTTAPILLDLVVVEEMA